MDAARQETVVALRRRLASMGGAAPALSRCTGAGSARRAAADAGRRSPDGFVAETNEAGTAWVRRRTVDLGEALGRSGAAAPPTPSGARSLFPSGIGGPPPPPGAAFTAVDIETVGLRGSGVLPFVVGLGTVRGHHLDVEQFLLADVAAEGALLRALLLRLGATTVLLSYNGRTFDLPVLRARCVVNRVPAAAVDDPPHCDLLAPVRRLFRDRLGACTLRRAEMDLLGLDRGPDVPGSEAAGRFRAWLRGAPDGVIEGVIEHNRRDVCGTVLLAARLIAHVGGRPVAPAHPADGYRLALHLDRCGRAADAEALLRAAVRAGAQPWAREAAHRLAQRLRRRGGEALEEAIAVWTAMARSDPGDLRAARSLAIALERSGRHDDALAVAERTRRLLAAMPEWRRRLLRGVPGGTCEEDWARRHRRLSSRRGPASLPLPLRAPGEPGSRGVAMGG